ncbi:MAG: transposase [Leptolyngbyaceae cyanobacterium]
MANEVASDNPKATEIEELKAFISKQRDARQVKKALAVKLFYQGYGYEAIIAIFDISMGSVANWKQAYEAQGLRGFQPRHQGRQGALSPADRAAVIEWLQQNRYGH